MQLLVFKNISWLILERAAQVIAVFIISGLISRQLGVVEYGEFQYVLSIIYLFSMIGLVCSSEVLLPKIVQANEKNVNELVITGFLLRLSASLVSYILILIYGIYFVKSEQVFFLLCLMGLTVLLREPFAVAIVYFQSKTYVKPIVVASISILFFKAAVIGISYYLGMLNIYIVGAVWLVEALSLSFVHTFLYLSNIKKNFSAVCWKPIKLKKIFLEGMVYWGALILMSFFWRIDRILVNNHSAAYEAGLYLAAMQMYDAVVSVALIVSISMAPSLIYKHTDESLIRSNTIKMMIVMLLLGFILSIMGFLLAPYFMPLIFGANFVGAVPIAQSAFCITILVFLDSALNVNLIKRRGANYALIKWIIVVMAALPIEYFAIRSWGSQGAHIGIFSGYILSIIFGVYQLKIKE